MYQPQMIGEGDCGAIGGMKIGRVDTDVLWGEDGVMLDKVDKWRSLRIIGGG
jgi:hypothetical protein